MSTPHEGERAFITIMIGKRDDAAIPPQSIWDVPPEFACNLRTALRAMFGDPVDALITREAAEAAINGMSVWDPHA